MKWPLIVLALVCSAQLASSTALTTTFAANNGGATGGAIYFTLECTDPSGVSITDLDLNFRYGGIAGSIDVYVKSGTWLPHTSAEYVLCTSGTVDTSAAGTPTNVVLATPLELGVGSPVGVAIVANGLAHKYSNGEGESPYTTTGLTLTVGGASNTPFAGSAFSPRLVNTNIYYSSGGATPTCLATPTPAASASGDVHVHYPTDARCDVRGPFDGALLNMHQTANLSVNARFAFSNFTLAPEDPRADAVREVRGSHLTAVYVRARAGGMAVEIEYDCAVRPYKPLVRATIDGQTPLEWSLTTASEPFVFDEMSIAMHKAEPVELVVATPDWSVVVKPAIYRAADGARKTRADMSIAALTDPLAARVAPHGILGQGFDGLHIDGKQDDYVADDNGVFVTSAQGEGAIEGSVADYVVASPFATEFTFGRFGKLAAPPRNVSKLNAPKGARKPMALAGATAAGDDASA